MTAIPNNFGAGGSGLTPRGSNAINLKDTLRDVADDLAGLQPVLTVEPVASDLATAIALVNELKGIVDTLAAVTLKTTKA